MVLCRPREIFQHGTCLQVQEAEAIEGLSLEVTRWCLLAVGL